jgi:phosphate transport system substrate-binding protein
MAALGAAAAVGLTAAACGNTNNVGSGSASTAASSPAATSLCQSAGNTKPGYTAPFTAPTGGASSLSGAGSTFVAPMLSDWTKAYSTSAGVQVAYQSIGSGGGVAQIQAGTVDFGASDTGMSDSDIAKAKAGGPILQIPLLLGAVVPAYHVTGVSSGLKFTGDILGQIYAGKITTWNDPAIAKINPGVTLPSEPIAVVHRSDSSGTTGIFTDYLTKQSPQWVSALGGATKSKGKTVAWPVGIGGKGNEGVSGAVNQTEGAIGYLELQYALAQSTTIGEVQNKSGSFIQPCIATVTAAVQGVQFPPSLNISLTDTANANGYPIAGTTYALVYQNQTDAAKAKALVAFFSWVLSKGQDMNADLNYAPLGADLDAKAFAKLKTIELNGSALVQ